MFCRLGIRLEVHSDHRTDFGATIRMLDLGLISVVAHRYPALEVRRTACLIRSDDPGLSQLVLNLRGELVLGQGWHSVRLDTDDLILLDCSRPFRAVHFVPPGCPGQPEAITIRLAPGLLAVPASRLTELSARRLSGRYGMGALLSGYLRDLSRRAEQYRPADAARLGPITLDLVSATLARHLDPEPAGVSMADDEAIYARVHTFVERRLSDPTLCPEMIATAQHISLRTLHRIFHAHGARVSGLIRTRRLERCRRDLADPRQAAQPIHTIAERWGFRDAAHFSRVFRTEYGISPRAFRTRQSGLWLAEADAQRQQLALDGDAFPGGR